MKALRLRRTLRFFNLSLIFHFLFLPFFMSGQEMKNGMVVSAEPFASKAGLKILREGGNSIDAAVAVGFALAVTYPVAGNIGGGGYMVIRTKDGKDIAIDYRESAPSGSMKDMYLDSAGNFLPDLSQNGALASGVPGSVAGLLYALEKYGSLPLHKVIQPAINLAENGFQLSESAAEKLNSNRNRFIKYPSSSSVFTKNGSEYREGEIFVQKDLAKTLRQIRDKGVNGFYDGWVAEKIVEQMKHTGGIMTREDLKSYKVIERTPLKGNYRGYEILSMPPSSSGGVALIQLLNILENRSFHKADFGSGKYFSLLSESMKRVYADRSEYLGDPDFFNVPAEWLTSKEYAKSIYLGIGDSVTPSALIKPGVHNFPKESEQTTHYSVYDKSGNAVSVTTTINSGFGSGLIVDGCGFFLNNEMDDFSAKPGSMNQFGLIGGTANSIQPGKRMLSSMTPTIVLEDGKPFLILGSPGGSTIITVVLQVILNTIDFDMPLKEAMDSPRIHHQWFPDEIQYEQDGITEDVWEELIKMGYKKGAERKLGLVEGIRIDHRTGYLEGQSDKRGSGKTEGF